MKVDFEVMYKAMELADGDTGALTILTGVLRKSPVAVQDIELLEKLEIKGLQIHKLFFDCCGGDFTILIYTLMLLRCNIFTEEQIKKNLGRFLAFPFMDCRIKLKFDSFDDFNPNNPNWREYCREQLYSFERRSGIKTAA